MLHLLLIYFKKSINNLFYFANKIIKIYIYIIYLFCYYNPFKTINKYEMIFLNFYENITEINVVIKRTNYVIKKHKLLLKLDYNLENLIDLKLKQKIYEKININNFIIFKPYKSVKKNILKKIKMYIRVSKCFAKTRYSIIRQECVNIVYFTMLLNIISILLFFQIYLKINIILHLYSSLLFLFVFYNFNWLVSFNLNIYNFFLNFYNYRIWNGFDD